ncbi:MAG: phytanoyl-CoA dioxygenase family protein [Candidatus Poribacteria bacterium]|nr:phytanoyl-CoA dioxygenase family protein [Candidatus Poribacteria bacterium]
MTNRGQRLKSKMEFTRLTPAQKEHFDLNGYLVIRNAIDQETIDHVVEIGDPFMTAELVREHGEPVAKNHYFNRYFNLTQDDVLLQLALNPSTVSLMTQLLTPDLRLSGGNLIYKYPQPASETPIYPDGDGRDHRNWHRDINNLAPEHPIRNTVSIRVAYCLTDFSLPNSGVTHLVAGSHRLTAPLRFQRTSATQPEADVDPPNTIEPQLQSGDAYLFNTLTYHASGVNFRGQVAKIVMATYAYHWWGGTTYSPDPSVFQQVDAIGGQLLGRRSDGEQPLVEWARQHGILYQTSPMRIYDHPVEVRW